MASFVVFKSVVEFKFCKEFRKGQVLNDIVKCDYLLAGVLDTKNDQRSCLRSFCMPFGRAKGIEDHIAFLGGQDFCEITWKYYSA